MTIAKGHVLRWSDIVDAVTANYPEFVSSLPPDQKGLPFNVAENGFSVLVAFFCPPRTSVPPSEIDGFLSTGNAPDAQFNIGDPVYAPDVFEDFRVNTDEAVDPVAEIENVILAYRSSNPDVLVLGIMRTNYAKVTGFNAIFLSVGAGWTYVNVNPPGPDPTQGKSYSLVVKMNGTEIGAFDVEPVAGSPDDTGQKYLTTGGIQPIEYSTVFSVDLGTLVLTLPPLVGPGANTLTIEETWIIPDGKIFRSSFSSVWIVDIEGHGSVITSGSSSSPGGGVGDTTDGTNTITIPFNNTTTSFIATAKLAGRRLP